MLAAGDVAVRTAAAYFIEAFKSTLTLLNMAETALTLIRLRLLKRTVGGVVCAEWLASTTAELVLSCCCCLGCISSNGSNSEVAIGAFVGVAVGVVVGEAARAAVGLIDGTTIRTVL